MTMVKHLPKAYPVGEFKTHCLRLMERVARSGTPILVTKRGEPLVRVIPTSPATWDEETWRERGRATTVLPRRDEDVIRPTGEVWTADQ
jgi:prevent-host-death family protein